MALLLGTELHAVVAPPCPWPQQRAEVVPSACRGGPASVTAALVLPRDGSPPCQETRDHTASKEQG